jgi:tetratricopeptide (TPR) repeat protein
VITREVRQALSMLACIACLVVNSGAVAAAESKAADKALTADILEIANSWAHIKFEEEDLSLQQRHILALADRASALMQKYPGRAEPVIWKGVLLSEGASMANEDHSMLTARSLAYQARDILLEAEKMDPAALEAGAPASLGVLYYRVPSFPIAFGDTDLARKYLEEAIRYSPNGMDANYFYGDFLYNQKDYAGAQRVWKHALTIPVNSERPVWDKSRRQVIQENLAKLAAKGN